MNQKIKDILGVTIAIAVLLVGFAAVDYSNSYGKAIQPSSFRSFSVTGNGKAVTIPDIAEFSFQIITEGGKDVASLQTQNTVAANKAIAFIKEEGVADKDIKTQYYNIDPRYQSYNCNVQPIYYNTPTVGSGVSGVSAGGSAGMIAPALPAVPPSMIVQPCPPSSIAGYTVTQSIDVKVRDFKKIGDILGGVVTNGANQVSALSFTLDDPTKSESEARADAISKAKAQAIATAQAGGFTLGRLLGIQEGYNQYPMYNYASGKGGGAMDVSAATPPSIQPGSQEVDMTVTLQYEIQ